MDDTGDLGRDGYDDATDREFEGTPVVEIIEAIKREGGADAEAHRPERGR